MIGEDIVTAAIDKNKKVLVTGRIGTEEKRQVAVMVKAPSGGVDYLDTSETAKRGEYQFSYTLTNETPGVYNVLVGARGLLLPLTASFEYVPESPDLSDLEL